MRSAWFASGPGGLAIQRRIVSTPLTALPRARLCEKMRPCCSALCCQAAKAGPKNKTKQNKRHTEN